MLFSLVSLKRQICNRRLPSMAHLLDIDLNVLLQIVAVQVEHQVMDKVEAVAHNNQGQLISQLGFLLKREQRKKDIQFHKIR